VKKDLRTLVIENLNGETADGRVIDDKLAKSNLSRLRDAVMKKIDDLKPKRPRVADLVGPYGGNPLEARREWEAIIGEWYELLNRIDVKLETQGTCRYCGGSMTQTCWPKYTGSDTIHGCCDNHKCGAHYYGKMKGECRWYSGQEWFDWVNSDD
jgi:hypothetical protein